MAGTRDKGNVKNIFVLDLCDFESGWSFSNVSIPIPRGGVAVGVVGRKFTCLGVRGIKLSKVVYLTR